MAAGMTSAAASEISSPVGVVAGGGAMPFAVAESLAARGITPVLFPLRGACDPARVEKFRHRWISVGQLGRAMRLFREEGCRDLIFIGTLVRPSLFGGSGRLHDAPAARQCHSRLPRRR
ncbi:DUF1009 family protein [Bradyrhizobium sp. F1.13.4]